MEVLSLLKSLVGGVGSVVGVAKKIAGFLGDGVDIDALRQQNQEILRAVESINKKVTELTGTMSDAIRMTQITDARDMIYNALDDLKSSIENDDQSKYAKALEYIATGGDGEGISHKLKNMDRALTLRQGASGEAILKGMAEKNWAKLQDPKQYDYGVREFDADYDSTIPFLITLEVLGLSLLLIYNNSRKDRTVAQKEIADQQACQESDERVQGWLDMFAVNKTGSSTAYKFLLADIRRQTQAGDTPLSKAPMIRSLVRKGYSKWGSYKNHEAGEMTLDGVFLVWVTDEYPTSYVVPVRRSNPRVEWKYSFNASTGRWTMTNALLPKSLQSFDCKLIPLPDAQGQTGRPMVFISVKESNDSWQKSIGGPWEFRLLPVAIEPSTDMGDSLQLSASPYSSRWFVARIENHSDYVLIPQTATRATADSYIELKFMESISSSNSLHGKDEMYDSPVLPNTSTYVSGRSTGLWTGATALFDFAVWKCAGIDSQSSKEANEARFHQCKEYGDQKDSQYPAQLGMQSEYATRVGTLVFMGSVSWGGGDKKGAMYASEFGPGEAYELVNDEKLTGGYSRTGSTSLTLKTVRVDFDMEQSAGMMSMSQPGTFFKIWNK
ncbi:hypothetical protein V8F20_004938 [Naviculisporaceae sp. PSN 640]